MGWGWVVLCYIFSSLCMLYRQSCKLFCDPVHVDGVKLFDNCSPVCAVFVHVVTLTVSVVSCPISVCVLFFLFNQCSIYVKFDRLDPSPNSIDTAKTLDLTRLCIQIFYIIKYLYRNSKQKSHVNSTPKVHHIKFTSFFL